MGTPRDASRQYASADPLKVRIMTHRRYEERPIDLDAACAGIMQLADEASVLDVGTGPGGFLGYLRDRGHRGRLVGLDTSPAMLAEAERAWPDVTWVQGDVQSLAFGEGEFTWVTARHMLYHVPDLPRALGACARVGERFLAVTNSERSLPRIKELRQEMAARFGLAPREPSSFSAEDAPGILGSVFAVVRACTLENALVFSEPEPIAAYIASGFAPADVRAQPERYAEIRSWLTAQARRRLQELGGVWRDPKAVGVFACRR